MPATFTSSAFEQFANRVRAARVRSAERREHDRAMVDPRIRDEHFAARARATDAGEGDCPFCA